MRVLLVEDDQETALTLKEELEEHFVVEVAYTGVDGEYQAGINEYDLLILDFFLPDINGIDVCKNIRKAGISTPILMLTGQLEVQNKVYALNSGADDYLTKPFNSEELLARVQALLRRQNRQVNSNILTAGDLTLDLTKKVAKRNQTLLNLRRKELYLLEYLMRNKGTLITRDMILDHIWESTTEPITNVVDVHIKYLRDIVDKPFKKKLIKTIHGLGYKLVV